MPAEIPAILAGCDSNDGDCAGCQRGWSSCVPLVCHAAGSHRTPHSGMRILSWSELRYSQRDFRQKFQRYVEEERYRLLAAIANLVRRSTLTMHLVPEKRAGANDEEEGKAPGNPELGIRSHDL